jgi:fatty acid desaturase
MGKGGANAKADSKGSDATTEVLVNGRYYDVTNLRHPGGSVIKFYAGKGIDATQAFDNFHVRSKKALKMLNSLPSREAKAEKEALPGQAALLADFKEFTAQLEKEGYFKPDYVHIVYRLAEIFFMHAIGAYLLFSGYYYTGIVILGIVSGRCGWLMHEGGHYSLTGNIAIDRQLQIWLYGVGCGMSGSWWRNQHNKHHSMPQKVDHDVDLNTLPLVAFTKRVVKKCGFSQKLWIRLQGYLFPIITCFLVAIGWEMYLHPRHSLRSKNYMELAAMFTRYAIWAYFFIPHFGLWGAIKVYMLYTWVASDYIFINFAVSHTHLGVVPADDTSVDWIRYAAVYTMNVKPGPFRFVNWWMSYLNFQIEHHLFPSMPQFRFPQISHRVKAFFEKHGLVYDQRSYTDAMAVTFQNLDKVGNDVFFG